MASFFKKLKSKFRKVRRRQRASNAKFRAAGDGALLIITGRRVNFRTVLNVAYHLRRKGGHVRVLTPYPKLYFSYLEVPDVKEYLTFQPVGAVRHIYTDSRLLAASLRAAGRAAVYIRYLEEEAALQEPGLLPYFPHPSFRRPTIGKDRAPGQSTRVIFLGNYTSRIYADTSEWLERTFAIPSRTNTITFLKARLGPPEEGGNKHCFAVSRKVELHINAPGQLKLNKEAYRQELLEADFFLACPGMTMPMCHNVIEAMLSGVVPIIAYSSWFKGFLEHGKNCLTFSNLEELQQVLESLGDYSRTEIENMKRAAVTAARDYLDSFEPGKDLVVINEHVRQFENFRRQSLYSRKAEAETAMTKKSS